MDSNKLKFIGFLLSFMALQFAGYGQSNKLLIASGGAFSNPNDHVVLTVHDEETNQIQMIGEVHTQAVQSVILRQDHLYVAATDSIVLFNIASKTKLNSIAITGPREMLVHEDKIFVTIQYPETSGFVKIYNASTLNLISVIDGISDEAAGMLKLDEKIYIAVPGSWMSTIGRLAVLNSDGLLTEEIELGEQGVGIYDLFSFQGKVISVNRSPWGAESGYLTVFDPVSKQVQHFGFPYVFGKGIGLFENKLYLLINQGIGSIDLLTMQVDQPQIVPDPGSASFISFADVVLDTVAGKFFATTTDYFSFGQGYVYLMDGSLTNTFEAGISAEALLLWNESMTSTKTNLQASELILSPNPATDQLFYHSDEKAAEFKIFDLKGRTLIHARPTDTEAINIQELPPGLYLLHLRLYNGEIVTKKFEKR